jgi:hypothetical protein
MMARSTVRVLFLVAVSAAIFGCASTNVSTIPYPNVPAFQATDPARIQVLRAEPPRAHAKLAEFIVAAAEPSGSSPSVQDVDDKLRTAAAKLGADAVVIVQDSIQPGLPVATGTWWGRTPGTHDAREVTGVAIKYR